MLTLPHYLNWLVPVAHALLILIAAATVMSVAYCLALLVGALAQLRKSVNPPGTDAAKANASFCILIPAHNEALVIESTLASIAALDYRKDMFRCVVVADNCTDETVRLARAVPDVEVLERYNAQLRGKGYALNYAVEQLAHRRDFEYFVIIDADTKMDKNFLFVMDEAIRTRELDGKDFVAQGLYQVDNSGDNWRTALMTGALSLVHFVRPMARERWGVSAGLKGNGMCFSASVLENLKWQGGSITEDIEYTLDLLERDSTRVRFVPAAIVHAQMPTDSAVAQGQRRRWERGRAEIITRRALPMLGAGILTFNKTKIDAALDLLCPPLAQMSGLFAIWAAMIGVISMLGAPVGGWLIAWVSALLGLVVYVVAGFKVGQAPALAYRALVMAGVYVPWKIATVLTGKARGASWNRTERIRIDTVEPAAAPPPPSDSLEAVNER